MEGEAVGKFSLQDLCFPLLFNISGMLKVDRLITSWRDETGETWLCPSRSKTLTTMRAQIVSLRRYATIGSLSGRVRRPL